MFSNLKKMWTFLENTFCPCIKHFESKLRKTQKASKTVDSDWVLP